MRDDEDDIYPKAGDTLISSLILVLKAGATAISESITLSLGIDLWLYLSSPVAKQRCTSTKNCQKPCFMWESKREVQFAAWADMSPG